MSEVKQNETASPDPFSLSVSLASYEELTPLHTPSSSPLPLRRQRLLSVATTQPVLKLVAEGFLQKLTKLSNLLHDKLMLSVLREADVLIPSRKAEGKCGGLIFIICVCVCVSDLTVCVCVCVCFINICRTVGEVSGGLR